MLNTVNQTLDSNCHQFLYFISKINTVLKRRGTCLLWRRGTWYLIKNQNSSLFSNAKCRNQTMLYCDLFIRLLSPSIIQPWNIDSLWNLCWSGKKCPLLPFNTFYNLGTYSLKTRPGPEKLQLTRKPGIIFQNRNLSNVIDHFSYFYGYFFEIRKICGSKTEYTFRQKLCFMMPCIQTWDRLSPQPGKNIFGKVVTLKNQQQCSKLQ